MKRRHPYKGEPILSVRLRKPDQINLRTVLRAKLAKNQTEAVRLGLECLAEQAA